MALILGLAAALFWGTGDYLVRIVEARIGVRRALLRGHLITLLFVPLAWELLRVHGADVHIACVGCEFPAPIGWIVRLLLTRYAHSERPGEQGDDKTLRITQVLM